ncbi:glycine--tRNA ligase subunit beta [Rhodobacterales bacterium 52_120_T64]|nr:glycine--tRNA ligase subunit beta [Rhodobacterales bacterium 52_120_T64]
MADLLLEIFSEEIPARMQKRAAADLKKLVTDGMVEAGITYESAAAFATPRRLCLSVIGVLEESPTLREERKGPRVGAPERAIEGFLRGAGLTLDDLTVRDDKKGQFYVAVIEKPGRTASDVIAEVVEATIRKFPWPKAMRWGAGTLRWVRPMHSILSILSKSEGAEVVPFEIDGIVSGDTTEGHRFMGNGRFAVSSFEDYEAKLKAAGVILNAEDRAESIWADATNLAFAQGLEVVEDAGLLAEVAGLVEWPVVLMGDIAEDFMGLPPEVLQTSMREHQKFFSVRNTKSGRIEKFITVANRETADNGATILAGNQKVLFARLSDAKFFWENDLRVSLEDMAVKLENVTFHNKLGTQAQRIGRIAALAREIAPIVGADADMAEQAAKIAKADLSSEMVYEFPELQGLMGRYYAQAAGLPQEVANACEMHYSPLGPSDDVPSEAVSIAVALADKIDTLTGFWAIDEKPTGSKDPFALRRAALGVIRLILENSVRFGLSDRIEDGFEEHRQPTLDALERKVYVSILNDYEQGVRVSEELVDLVGTRGGKDAQNINDAIPLQIKERHIRTSAKNLAEMYRIQKSGTEWRDHFIPARGNLIAFFHDRLKVYLKAQGITHDVIDACLAMPNNDDLTLLVNRVTALQAFVNTDDGVNLLQGYKRANNILAAEEKKDGVSYEGEPEIRFAESAEEKALFAALDAGEVAISTALDAEDFSAAMAAMANLRSPIDAFFDSTQVNSGNQIVRRNRLCLLNRIRVVMHKVAIFSALNG